MSEPIRVEVRGGAAEQRGGGVLRRLLMLPGLGFIGLGVAILVWPELLVWLVAGVFFVVGLGLIFVARKVGSARERFAYFESTFRGPS